MHTHILVVHMNSGRFVSTFCKSFYISLLISLHSFLLICARLRTLSDSDLHVTTFNWIERTSSSN